MSKLVNFSFEAKGLLELQLSPEVLQLSAGHLQIPFPREFYFKCSIGDVLKRFKSVRPSNPRWKERQNCLTDLALTSDNNGQINWMQYWELREYKFQHLCMTCVELDRLVEDYASLPINQKSFGKAGISLGKLGIANLECLATYLKNGCPLPSGFGSIKRDQLFERLLSYIKIHESGKPLVEMESDLQNNINENRGNGRGSLIRLDNSELSISLKGIHLGKKNDAFARDGINTLGDLIELASKGFPSIRSVGPKTMRKVEEVLSAVSTSLNEAGKVDWGKFADRLGMPMIPTSFRITSGEDFVSSLPTVCDELISVCRDETERDIFRERMTKKRSIQKTLSELGAIHNVTRERIRQKEKMLLNRLSDALLYDEYLDLEFRFSSDFSRYFKQAASAFRKDERSLSIEQFLLRIQEVWGVHRSKIIPHATLITSILTLSSVKSSDLQIDQALPILLWDSLPVHVVEKPLKELPLGGHIAFFQSHGLSTLGGLISAILNREIEFAKNNIHFQCIKSIMDDLASTLDSGVNEEYFWLEFAAIRGMDIVPISKVDGVYSFIDSLHAALICSISANQASKINEQIYSLRTSKSLQERKTLEETSSAVGGYGSDIKKKETRFVRMLNQHLIDGDLTNSGVFYRSDFRKYWNQANQVYQSSRDFPDFSVQIAKSWGVPISVLSQHVDIIWTVLNIYPNARKVTKLGQQKQGPSEKIVSAETNFGIIKLRGFRSVH